MTTAQISRIAPPPSVEAVLGALTEETRIGQVDFSERLMPEPLAAELDTAAAEVAATTGEAGPDDDASDAGLELDDTTDQDDTADQDDTDDDDAADPDDAGEVTATVVTLKSVPEPEPELKVPARKRASRSKPLAKALTPKRRVARSTATTDVDVTETVVIEATEPVTDDGVTDDAAETATDDVTEAVAEPETGSETVEYPVPASIAERVHTPGAVLPDRIEDNDHGPLAADLDERPPTVEEIARLVVERMHDAELAMMRHLEAVEAEAARRCELLTAQAELDAELIRLNARREAHGIVTEARMRADGAGDGAADQEQLEDLTVALSRFADAVDELRPSPPRPTSGRTP